MRLVQFGGGSQVYRFPAQTGLTHNFGNGLTQPARLPGMDGAFDPFGDEPLLSEAGTLAFDWWLHANGSSITQLKAQAAQVRAWGRRPLWIAPEDGSALRWCGAKADNLRMSENVKDMPHVRQRVQSNWSVSYPRWLSKPNHVHKLNELTLNAGMTLVDAPARYLDAGGLNCGLTLNTGQELSRNSLAGRWLNGTRFEIVNAGDSYAAAVIRVQATKPLIADGEFAAGDLGVMVGYVGSRSARDIEVRRLDGAGNTVEAWRWSGTLAMGDSLTVDSRWPRRVLYETEQTRQSGFDQFEIRQGRGWIRLAPGSNTLEIRGELDGPFAWITVNFFDTWAS